MLTNDQVAEAAAALYRAEMEDQPIASISKTYPGATVADAYAISLAVTALKVKAGRTVKGHKIGLVSKAMRTNLGATEPDYGALFDDWIFLENSNVKIGENRRSVELETAFVMKAPLRGPGVTVVDVIRATDFILPCIEVVGMRQSGGGTNMLVDSISDAAACAGVVLGARPVRLTDIDVRRIGGTLMVNNEIEKSGVNGSILGNPINAVVWLANKLNEYGVNIEEGQVVLPGSFLQAHPIKPGDVVAGLFDTLGEVTFRAE